MSVPMGVGAMGKGGSVSWYRTKVRVTYRGDSINSRVQVRKTELHHILRKGNIALDIVPVVEENVATCYFEYLVTLKEVIRN